MKALDVYNGSSGEITSEYYRQLRIIGPLGIVAMNLFRAQKCSARAKAYRKGRWIRDAYERKQYSIEQLCLTLEEHGSQLGITYGWKEDPNVLFGGEYEESKSSWVLYIDLPIGQVSFHSPTRSKVGPLYPGEWDGIKGASIMRVLQFCDETFAHKNTLQV